MTDHDLWQHLEAEFARVLGEVPKPKGQCENHTGQPLVNPEKEGPTISEG